MIIKICGIIIICFASVLIAKSAGSKISFFIPVTALICTITIVLIPLSNEFKELFSNYDSFELSEYVVILTKALGISVISSVTSEICTSCGENLLSNIAVFSGKAEIMLLCIPLIKSVLEISGEML